MQAEAVFFDFRVTRRRLVTLVAVVVALVALALLYRKIDMPALHQRAEAVNGVLVFALMTVLPLAGFPGAWPMRSPASGSDSAPGSRWNRLARAAVARELCAGQGEAETFCAPPRASEPATTPKGAHASVTQFTMLLPGAPFFAQVYVLPLVGVPLGIYLRCEHPDPSRKTTIGVVFGDMSDDLTPVRIAGFVTYTILVIAASAWAFRRLRERMQAPPPKAGGRKRRA